MGQYFKIFNRTRANIQAVIPMNINFGLPWVAKLDRFPTEDQIMIFNLIIQHNNWSTTDVLVARGDYGDTVTFENGEVSEGFEEPANDFADEEDQDELYRSTLANAMNHN